MLLNEIDNNLRKMMVEGTPQQLADIYGKLGDWNLLIEEYLEKSARNSFATIAESGINFVKSHADEMGLRLEWSDTENSYVSYVKDFMTFRFIIENQHLSVWVIKVMPWCDWKKILPFNTINISIKLSDDIHDKTKSKEYINTWYNKICNLLRPKALNVRLMAEEERSVSVLLLDNEFNEKFPKVITALCMIE